MERQSVVPYHIIQLRKVRLQFLMLLSLSGWSGWAEVEVREGLRKGQRLCFDKTLCFGLGAVANKNGDSYLTDRDLGADSGPEKAMNEAME